MEDVDFQAKHKGLLVTHLNVRSLWNKIDLIRSTFKDFYVDIITFSETWLVNEIPDGLVDIEGYELYRNDRNWTQNGSDLIKKGGGVCTYIKNDLKTRSGHIAEIAASNADIESQYIEILFENQKNVLIVNLYKEIYQIS